MPTDQTQSTSALSAEEQASAALQATMPVKTKTGVGKLIATVVSDIEAPFNWAGKEWGVIQKEFAKLDPILQADLKAVSGIVQTLKTEVDQSPVIIQYLIQKAYPQFSITQLDGYFTTSINGINAVGLEVGPDLLTTIGNVLAYAKSLTSSQTSPFWTNLFNLIATEVTPGTPWGKLVAFGLYIYNTFFKLAVTA